MREAVNVPAEERKARADAWFEALPKRVQQEAIVTALHESGATPAQAIEELVERARISAEAMAALRRDPRRSSLMLKSGMETPCPAEDDVVAALIKTHALAAARAREEGLQAGRSGRCEVEARDSAIGIAERYGAIDFAHHKQWVIDQMVRTLLGPSRYAEWVHALNSDPDYAAWDEGIAP